MISTSSLNKPFLRLASRRDLKGSRGALRCPPPVPRLRQSPKVQQNGHRARTQERNEWPEQSAGFQQSPGSPVATLQGDETRPGNTGKGSNLPPKQQAWQEKGSKQEGSTALSLPGSQHQPQCLAERSAFGLCVVEKKFCTFLECQANASENNHTSCGMPTRSIRALAEPPHPAGAAVFTDNKGLASA